MHFPVQILAENTYLTSYFNEKIKNSKWYKLDVYFWYFLLIEIEIEIEYKVSL